MNSKMISGFGQFHTNEVGKTNRKAYSAISLADILTLVDNPQQIGKSKAQWVIPSTLETRNFKKQEEHGEYWILWADLDTNPKTLAEVKAILTEILDDLCYVYNFEIYASKSARQDCQKGRILIPLAQPISGADWLICQELLNDKLEANGITPDRKSQCSAQLCYLPNRGEFYEAHSERDGVAFNPMATWTKEISANKQYIVDAKLVLEASKAIAAERKAALKLTLDGNGIPDTIGAYNIAYSVQEVLLDAGYDQRGEIFRHPNSESGSFSASVKNNRVHSLSSADPLYTEGGGVGAHDAFSAFTILVHKGDTNAALKDAGDNKLTIDGEPLDNGQAA